MIKFWLVFLVLLMVIAINLPGGMLSGFGVSPNILVATLVAFIMAGMVEHQKLGLIALVVVVALAANVPRAMAASIGYDRDIMIAVLAGLVILPFVAKQI